MTATQDGTPAAAAPRTKAHDHGQLAAALGWTHTQVDKAVTAGGILPPYDLSTPRWKGATVDALVGRAEELAALLPDLYSETELQDALGLSRGDWHRGREAAVIPDPDLGAFWTRPLVDDLTARAAALRAAIPPQPLGLTRCAELLAELTGLPVVEDDIRALVKRELVAEVDYYKKWALYDVAAVRALGTTDDGRQVVEEIVADRLAWLAASITPQDAARWLDWHPSDLERITKERGLKPGRFGRWERTIIAELTADEDLIERVRREQLLGPDQAAAHMEIRRRDFDYVLAAGWLTAATHVTREVGVRKTVDIPLYSVGDLENVIAEVPGVDWEAVRAVKPGEVSPLREYTRLPAARAEVIRAFCAELGDRYAVEVWPHFWNAGDKWEIDWEYTADGHPTKAEVTAALSDHYGASQHWDHIVLSTAVGEVIRWARACLEPGAAVVVDTETTGLGGVVIELAVVDASTGACLLNTLVNPGGVEVEDGARFVHGISDDELAGAPSWAEVFPRFLAAVEGKKITAYNSDFDKGRISATHRHAGLDTTLLPSSDRWGCLMNARSTWLRIGRWLPLGGGHRALGDALDARTVLQALGAPATR
ncbi:hypothetical protein GCM10027589_04660 [Actinocorallia lasiicapitis]